MRFLPVALFAILGGVLAEGAPVWGDATPPPVRPCDAKDEGKRCPPSFFNGPETCQKTICFPDEESRERRHGSAEVIGGLGYDCYRCQPVRPPEPAPKQDMQRAAEQAAEQRRQQEAAPTAAAARELLEGYKAKRRQSTRWLLGAITGLTLLGLLAVVIVRRSRRR